MVFVGTEGAGVAELRQDHGQFVCVYYTKKGPLRLAIPGSHYESTRVPFNGLVLGLWDALIATQLKECKQKCRLSA